MTESTGMDAARSPRTALLSVVVPMRNESANIDGFFEHLLPVLQRIGMSYEVICVDDGSTDDTFPKLLSVRARDANVKVILLARNFGKEHALTAGLDHASGDAVVPIDADLQDPPEVIEQLVSKWREGYDVVYAKRASRRGEGWLKLLTARGFYRVFNRFSDVPIPEDTGDFRLMDRRVADALGKCRESGRFMKGLFAWVGFKQAEVLYGREPRHRGRTTWSYWRLLKFAMRAFSSHSTTFLHIAGYAGIVLAFLSTLYAIALAARKIFFGADVPGYTSLMVAILMLGAAQLISLGVLGAFVGRIYEEVKRRPLYLVRERVGFDTKRER